MPEFDPETISPTDDPFKKGAMRTFLSVFSSIFGALPNNLIGIRNRVVKTSVDDDGLWICGDGQPALFENDPIGEYRFKPIPITGTTLTITDAHSGCSLRFTNASGCTVTLAKASKDGSVFKWLQDSGAGVITFAAEAGASMQNYSGHTKSAGVLASGSCEVVENSDNESARWQLDGLTQA